jgi:hypothetical protein
MGWSIKSKLFGKFIQVSCAFPRCGTSEQLENPTEMTNGALVFIRMVLTTFYTMRIRSLDNAFSNYNQRKNNEMHFQSKLTLKMHFVVLSFIIMHTRIFSVGRPP